MTNAILLVFFGLLLLLLPLFLLISFAMGGDSVVIRKKDHFRERFPKEEEFIDFFIWAFGEESLGIEELRFLISSWNKRHGGTIKFNLEGDVTSDIDRMVALWRVYKRRTK